MWFDNSAWKELERISNLHRQIMNSQAMELMEKFNQRQAIVQNMADTLMNPAWQSALSQTEPFQKK